jgi:hypothetical protein
VEKEYDEGPEWKLNGFKKIDPSSKIQVIGSVFSLGSWNLELGSWN